MYQILHTQVEVRGCCALRRESAVTAVCLTLIKCCAVFLFACTFGGTPSPTPAFRSRLMGGLCARAHFEKAIRQFGRESRLDFAGGARVDCRVEMCGPRCEKERHPRFTFSMVYALLYSYSYKRVYSGGGF
jgi:hypothetical protein